MINEVNGNDSLIYKTSDTSLINIKKDGFTLTCIVCFLRNLNFCMELRTDDKHFLGPLLTDLCR